MPENMEHNKKERITMGKSVRCISQDGTLTIMAVDSTDIVNKAQEIHGTSAVCSAALG